MPFRDNLFGAIPLRDGYATHPRQFRDGYATHPRQFRDASATGTRPIRDASGDGCATQPRRLRACTPGNPADNLNNIQSKATPSPQGNLPTSALGGRGQPRKRVPTRQSEKVAPPSSPPSRVQGAQPTPGVQRVPPVPKNIGGWARWDNGVRRRKPLLSGLPLVLAGRLESALPPLQNPNGCAIVPP